MVGSVALGFLGLITLFELAPLVICPIIGIFVFGITLLISARFMPRKSDAGAELAARLRAFRTYLQDIDRYADLEQQKTIWDRWLPYAVAFGIDKSYIAKFERAGAPAPAWYFPTPGSYDPTRSHWGGAGGGWSMGQPGGGEGSGDGKGFGGGLSQGSTSLGGTLSGMSVGLGSLLSSASNTFGSQPSSSGSGGGGGWSGGGGFG
jgi:hypothetical protein